MVKWKANVEIKENKKKISRGESDFHYFKNIICCKWYKNKPVLRLLTNVDDISGISNVIRRSKVSVTKTPVSCPNIIKLYNNGIGGVDIAQQTFAGLQDALKTSSRRICKTSSRRLGRRKIVTLKTS